MLKIYFGAMDKTIYNSEIHFKNDYMVVAYMAKLLKTAGGYV